MNTELLKLYMQLVEKQAQYIDFLTDRISDVTPFLRAHNIETSEKEIQSGMQYRREIHDLLQQILKYKD